MVQNVYLAISLLTLVLISSSSTALAQSGHLERGLGPSGVVKLQRNKNATEPRLNLVSFRTVCQEIFKGWWGTVADACNTITLKN